jgi:hypothetical protein
MAILGGSPLGLIGVSSTTTATGRSTFNDGDSRAANVALYNRNSSNTYSDTNKGNSLFSGSRMLRAWPEAKSFSNGYNGANDIDETKIASDKKADPNGSYKQRALHNNNVYDTSVLNIIENLSGTIGSLKMADFAYLKDLGVYPNNRLMIARRFASPIGDNIIIQNKKGVSGALATLMTWQPADTDFLNISFGEKWVDAKADFKDLLNNLGGDLSKSGDTGTLGILSGKAISAIPLPGFTEIFQRRLLSKIGIFDSNADQTVPSGNPNIIKEAKRRSTVDYGTAGSGLSCTVSIEMTCEYELKFISGIDPTIVWMDILATVLSFGTSKKDTYGLNPKLGEKVGEWMDNPNTLVRDAIDGLKNAISSITDEIKSLWETGKDVLVGLYGGVKEAVTNSGTASNTTESKKDSLINSATTLATQTFDLFKNIAGDILNVIVLKYRVEIMGIVQALSGMPSTPWHITIGNPMRPMFCSGDMLTQDVKITLGPVLAFNDLPSSIKATFTLTNARPWGLQEIMAKFNSGYIRTVDTSRTMFDSRMLTKSDGSLYYQQTGTLGYGGVIGTSSTTTAATTATTTGTTPNTTQTSTVATTKEIELDPAYVHIGKQTKIEGGQKTT